MLPDVHIFSLTWKRNFSAGYTYFLVGVFFRRLGGVGGFPQSSPMILGHRKRKNFGEYLPEKKTQVLKLQIRFQINMFQNFEMATSCAHLWDFSLVLLTANEKNFEGVCLFQKAASSQVVFEEIYPFWLECANRKNGKDLPLIFNFVAAKLVHSFSFS